MGGLVIDGQVVDVPFATRLAVGSLPTKARSASIKQIILHHDACRSADECVRVLRARSLSTHFVIDNDGAVVQVADPARLAFHCLGEYKDPETGKTLHARGFNSRSIGIDISNAVLPKYAASYKPPRAQATLPIHGRPMAGLLPYDHQVTAVVALVRFLCQHYQIPVVTRASTDWVGDILPWTPGVWGHLHVCQGKCDPFGFPFDRLQQENS